VDRHPVAGEAACVLGPSFAGVLVRDGWTLYRQFNVVDSHEPLSFDRSQSYGSRTQGRRLLRDNFSVLASLGTLHPSEARFRAIGTAEGRWRLNCTSEIQL
jgi:hypothetical protein